MVKELYDICDLETDGSKVGWKKRREAMEMWLGKYLFSVDTSMSVVNPQVFDSEFMDFIKESLAKKLAEDLTTYTRYDITDKKINAKLVVVNGNTKK